MVNKKIKITALLLYCLAPINSWGMQPPQPTTYTELITALKNNDPVTAEYFKESLNNAKNNNIKIYFISMDMIELSAEKDTILELFTESSTNPDAFKNENDQLFFQAEATPGGFVCSFDNTLLKTKDLSANILITPAESSSAQKSTEQYNSILQKFNIPTDVDKKLIRFSTKDELIILNVLYKKIKTERERILATKKALEPAPQEIAPEEAEQQETPQETVLLEEQQAAAQKEQLEQEAEKQRVEREAAQKIVREKEEAAAQQKQQEEERVRREKEQAAIEKEKQDQAIAQEKEEEMKKLAQLSASEIQAAKKKQETETAEKLAAEKATKDAENKQQQNAIAQAQALSLAQQWIAQQEALAHNTAATNSKPAIDEEKKSTEAQDITNNVQTLDNLVSWLQTKPTHALSLDAFTSVTQDAKKQGYHMVFMTDEVINAIGPQEQINTEEPSQTIYNTDNQTILLRLIKIPGGILFLKPQKGAMSEPLIIDTPDNNPETSLKNFNLLLQVKIQSTHDPLFLSEFFKPLSEKIKTEKRAADKKAAVEAIQKTLEKKNAAKKLALEEALAQEKAAQELAGKKAQEIAAKVAAEQKEAIAAVQITQAAITAQEEEQKAAQEKIALEEQSIINQVKNIDNLVTILQTKPNFVIPLQALKNVVQSSQQQGYRVAFITNDVIAELQKSPLKELISTLLLTGKITNDDGTILFTYNKAGNGAIITKYQKNADTTPLIFSAPNADPATLPTNFKINFKIKTESTYDTTALETFFDTAQAMAEKKSTTRALQEKNKAIQQYQALLPTQSTLPPHLLNQYTKAGQQMIEGFKAGTKTQQQMDEFFADLQQTLKTDEQALKIIAEVTNADTLATTLQRQIFGQNSTQTIPFEALKTVAKNAEQIKYVIAFLTQEIIKELQTPGHILFNELFTKKKIIDSVSGTILFEYKQLPYGAMILKYQEDGNFNPLIFSAPNTDPTTLPKTFNAEFNVKIDSLYDTQALKTFFTLPVVSSTKLPVQPNPFTQRVQKIKIPPFKRQNEFSQQQYELLNYLEQTPELPQQSFDQVDEFLRLVESDTPQNAEQASQVAPGIIEQLTQQNQKEKKEIANAERSSWEEAQEIAQQLKTAEERKNFPNFDEEPLFTLPQTGPSLSSRPSRSLPRTTGYTNSSTPNSITTRIPPYRPNLGTSSYSGGNYSFPTASTNYDGGYTPSSSDNYNFGSSYTEYPENYGSYEPLSTYEGYEYTPQEEVKKPTKEAPMAPIQLPTDAEESALSPIEETKPAAETEEIEEKEKINPIPAAPTGIPLTDKIIITKTGAGLKVMQEQKAAKKAQEKAAAMAKKTLATTAYSWAANAVSKITDAYATASKWVTEKITAVIDYFR